MNSLDILTSAASGGLLGLIGNLSNGLLGFFQRRQEQNHLIERLRWEHEGIKLQAKADAARLAGELASAREKGAAAAFERSLATESSLAGGFRWVDAARSLTRPGLTWFFVITAALIVGMPSLLNDANEMQQYAAVTVVNMASMVTAWWFGQRQIDKHATRWGNAIAGANLRSDQPLRAQ